MYHCEVRYVQLKYVNFLSRFHVKCQLFIDGHVVSKIKCLDYVLINQRCFNFNCRTLLPRYVDYSLILLVLKLCIPAEHLLQHQDAAPSEMLLHGASVLANGGMVASTGTSRDARVAVAEFVDGDGCRGAHPLL